MARATDLPTAPALAATLEAHLAWRPPREIPGGRRAAVLLMLFDHDGAAHTLLTKRSDALPVHRGQIALPGGRYEPADATLWTTALRETEEEVGVARELVLPVGRLDDVATIATDFVVTPYVGLVSPRPATRADASEVARIMEVPIGDILAADARLPERPTVETLRYPLLGEDVWGATARILRAFVAEIDAAVAPS